jgi:indolepyruvate ferredoxin oxidoreductase, beta subunit
MKTIGMLVTGVGGQGIILASDIICEAAISAGYDVKKTDTIGMAQRGGSVLSHVRIGEKVWSPLIREGEVDLLLAFEILEAARWSNYLHRDSTVIINRYAQPPLSVNLGNDKYPDDAEVKKLLNQRTPNVYFVEGNTQATKAGDSRALNTFMLGCASCFLPLEINIWEDTISQRVPAKFKRINMTAFEAGRKELNNVGRR